MAESWTREWYAASTSSAQVIGGAAEPRPRTVPPSKRTASTGSPALGGELGEPFPDLLAGGLDRPTVEVCARARGGGRGVGDLVGSGRGDPDQVERHAQGGCGDLGHLRVQALAHLGAAVVDEHRAVPIDQDERARLVVGREVERDAELHRGDRQCLFVCRCEALNSAISAVRRSTVAEVISWSQTRGIRSAWRTS